MPPTPNVPPLVQHPTLSITTYLSVRNWVDISVTPRQYSASPRPTYCTGRCREESGDDTNLTANVVGDKHFNPHTQLIPC